MKLKSGLVGLASAWTLTCAKICSRSCCTRIPLSNAKTARKLLQSAAPSTTMTSSQPEGTTVPLPKTVMTTLKICEFMTSLGFSPKEFMMTFFSSTNKDIDYCRRLMRAGLGTKGTRSIVKNFGKLTSSCAAGQEEWEAIILEQASAIVIKQELQRGYFPAGSYTSSNRITPDYFSESAETHRADQVRKGMKFLYSLIHCKLAHALKNKSYDPEDDHEEPSNQPTMTTPATHQDGLSAESSIEDLPDEATVLSLENLVFVKTTPESLAAHKLDMVPTMLCSMLAVACNRRNNAVPLANGLMTLAAGVSCRVNEWLHTLGLTTSRTSILQAMEHLCVLQEQRMMELFKVNHKIMPHLFSPVPRDVGILQRNTINPSSEMFRRGREHCEVPGIHVDSQSPTSRYGVVCTYTTGHGALVISHQDPARKSSQRICESHTGRSKTTTTKHLTTSYRSNRNAQTKHTFPPVLDAVMAQIGVDKEKYAEKLLVAGGDVGSNQLVESLRVKRYPPIKALEGIDWVLSIFGGAHTTWNFAKSIWAHHWGHSDKGEDSGVWRSAFALGLEYKKPVPSQDFNSIMRSLQIVHKSNLVFVIKKALESMNDIDLSTETGVQKVFDTVWNQYFDAKALAAASKAGSRNGHRKAHTSILKQHSFGRSLEDHCIARADH
ncbi:uncharacterized protein MELLADRAFT_105330 [Melampsora larici-populina 98AG31]|uniref:DUF6589 domain-containing protein n=1 Tax=Melampsora larici-populina (strain 98AG31 / pathotype 3-4-7) TaxID=747676 RepID=F4RHS2_MELLP|nr:uncharacterized protein MELLADRAFT_105330 [Melampsora larici-populina 98AG31]EGG08084.1 hypothetical protein MELLADRAFT_105330 [Melampsora larici-populina 98AG31]